MTARASGRSHRLSHCEMPARSRIFPPPLRKGALGDRVRERIPFDLDPLLAAELVEPELAVAPPGILSEIEIPVPFRIACLFRASRSINRGVATIGELRVGTLATPRT